MTDQKLAASPLFANKLVISKQFINMNFECEACGRETENEIFHVYGKFTMYDKNMELDSIVRYNAYLCRACCATEDQMAAQLTRLSGVGQ